MTPSTATTVPAPGIDPMVPRRFVVTRTRLDSRDTHTLQLEAVDGGPLEFQPGQFTMLQVFGVGEVPISVSGDPARPEVLQHTIRDVGAVTHALATTPPGAVLGVRGPFGRGWPVDAGRDGDVVFVAGGIGLAPLRPAVLRACAERARFDRVTLLYGARTPEDLLFSDDLLEWAEEHRVAVEVTVDNGQHAWRGRVGLVTDLVRRGGFDPSRSLALVCGPEVMMRLSARALTDRGVPASRVMLSLERNMMCGIGLCGHCQLREYFLCVDGPVLPFDRVESLIDRQEL